jgi:hypothetical protein
MIVSTLTLPANTRPRRWKEALKIAAVLDDIEGTEDIQVEDDAAEEPAVAAVQYDISSFGADYDVEGLVNRIQPR